MKKNRFWIFVLLFFIVSCNSRFIDKESIPASSIINCEFGGAAEQYSDKYNLISEIKDDSIRNRIISLMDSLEPRYNCQLRKVMYQIKLSVEVESEKKWLFFINANTNNEVYVTINRNCYKNEELENLIKEIVHVNDIGDFQGVMTQKDYDKIQDKVTD